MSILKYDTINVDHNNDILTISLNRPDKRNALNSVMINELHNVFTREDLISKIYCVILTGEGSSFCAGADLSYLKSLKGKSYHEHLNDSNRLKDMYKAIYSYPKPVLALVNGPAIGGGCGLANICDFVFASDTASFGYPEVKIGFTPAIVSVFLVNSIGYRKAKSLLLSGKILSAEEAKDYGIVNQVVKAGKLLSFGYKYANELEKNSPKSISLTKKFINQINNSSNIENSLNESAEFNAASRLEPDFNEGISSFLEKRKPNWKK